MDIYVFVGSDRYVCVLLVAIDFRENLKYLHLKIEANFSANVISILEKHNTNKLS